MSRAKKAKHGFDLPNLLRQWAPKAVKWVAGLAVCFLIIWRLFLASDFFAIKSINVQLEGADVDYSIFDDAVGKNIFKFDILPLRDAIAQNYPFYDSIVIAKELPDRLNCIITLKRPIAYVRTPVDIFLIDENGLVLPKDLEVLNKDLVEITLSKEIVLKEGEVITKDSLFKAIEFIKAFSEVNADNRVLLKYIDADSDYELVAVINDGISLRFRNRNYKKSLQRFFEQLDRNPQYGQRLENLRKGSFFLFNENNEIILSAAK